MVQGDPGNKIQCPFVGHDTCTSGNGRGLARRYFLKHLTQYHWTSKEEFGRYRLMLESNRRLFMDFELILKEMGIWFCGQCFVTHTKRIGCRHNDIGDPTAAPARDGGEMSFVISHIKQPDDVPIVRIIAEEDDDQTFTFNSELLDRLFKRKITTVKTIPAQCRLNFARVFRGAMEAVIHNCASMSNWVLLLALPLCTLRIYHPKNSSERKSKNRRELQLQSITRNISLWRSLGGANQVIQETLAEPTLTWSPDNEDDLGVEELNIKQCKRKLGDGHYAAAIRILTSSGIAPENEDTLSELVAKHPEAPPPVIPVSPIHEEAITATKDVVLERIRSFPKGTSCGRDGLRAQHLMEILGGSACALADETSTAMTGIVNLLLAGRCPKDLGEYIASAPLTPLIKPGGGIRPIAVGTVWRRLTSKVAAISLSKHMERYFEGLQFGVGVSGGGEAILHAVNRLVEDRQGDDTLTLLLVDFKNAFNLVDRSVMIREVREHCPSMAAWVEFCYARPARLYYGNTHLWSCMGVQQGDPLGPLLFALVLHPLILKIRASCHLLLQAWYLDDGTIAGDTLIVSEALRIIMEDGPSYGLTLNVDKTEVFLPKEDPRSRMDGVFPPTIARPTSGSKLLGGSVCVDETFGRDLANKRVAKTVALMQAVGKLRDPQCELLLLRSCVGVSRLYFALRTSPPELFVDAQAIFDAALRVALEKIITDSGPGFGDLQWRIATLPIRMGGLGIYCAKDALQFAFVASRRQTAVLQDVLLDKANIRYAGSCFDRALDTFTSYCGVNSSSICAEIPAPRLMNTLAGLYFSQVEKELATKFGFGPRHHAVMQCLKQPYAQNYLKAIPISGLGQTMNARQFRCVLKYRTFIPMYEEGGECPGCKKKVLDQWGDHCVHCAADIGTKYRHDLVRDCVYDVIHRAGLPIKKEANVGLVGANDEVLKPADLLVKNWENGKDVCFDVVGCSPFSGTGTAGFFPGNAIANAALRKKVKYGSACEAAGLGFKAFVFSTWGELGTDAVDLLARVQAYAKNNTTCSTMIKHIWNRVGFCVIKGVGAQLVSRLPSNFL